ncbi:unnamed protein product [Chrysoparadoxa australica]
MAQDLSPEQQEQLIQRLQAQVQEQAIQELVQKMTEKCFTKCAKPSRGDRLDNNEQSCIALCMDRYIDAMGVVNKAMVERQNRR